MTYDPHSAERLILIGCHDALARKHALRLMLQPSERQVWIDLTQHFLNTTVKYDSTSCAVFVDPQFRDWNETKHVIALTHAHYKQARINQNTVESIAEAQGRNFIRNLRLIALRSFGFESATAHLQSMKGRTAIVCGAGPSFEQSATLVAAHRGPIIAVNTSAGACAQRDIRPDVVLCTESKLVREGIVRMDTRASRFAMDLMGHAGNWWREEDLYCNPQLAFLGTEPNLMPYAEMLGLLPLAYGSSCTTAAVSLALAMGAERVALVGQDCAFQVNGVAGIDDLEALLQHADGTIEMSAHVGQYLARMYASGTPYEETVVTIKPDTMRALIQKPTVPEHTVEVVLADGLGDEKVFSTHSMLSFAHWFRDQPDDVRSRIVNCTDSGARIEGIEERDLRDVIEREVLVPMDQIANAPQRYHGSNNNPMHFGLEEDFSAKAGRVLKHLTNVAKHGLGIQNGDAFLIEWARKHPITNMWIAPVKLRMRRQDDLSPAERGHRVAMAIRTACSEIVACANGEM